MTKQEASPCRLFLGVLALVALAAQLVVIPRTAAGYASEYPEVAYLEPMYVTALVVALVGFEVALLAAWQMVSAAVAGRTLCSRSALWINIATASLGFMAVLVAGVCVHAGSVVGVGGPAMLFGLLISLALVPVAFALRHWGRGWSARINVHILSAD